MVSAMHALKDRAGPVKGVALVLVGILFGIALVGVHAVAQTGSPVKTTVAPEAAVAKAHCQYASPGGPCAPIMSSYTYWGFSEGDLSLIKAKLGPNKIVGHVYKSFPTPGEYSVNERTFTWHSVAAVEIVGAYILHFKGSHGVYTKVPSGEHSGHTSMKETQGTSSPPILVLQGRHTA